MDKRTAVETEINVINERLSQPVGLGLSGKLVDSEVAKFLTFSIDLYH